MKFITLNVLNQNLKAFFNNIVKPYITKELTSPTLTLTANVPDWWTSANGNDLVVPVGQKVYISMEDHIITVEGNGETTLANAANIDGFNIKFVGEVNGAVIAHAVM